MPESSVPKSFKRPIQITVEKIVYVAMAVGIVAAVPAAVDNIRWWNWRSELAGVAYEVYRGRLIQERYRRDEVEAELKALEAAKAPRFQISAKRRELADQTDEIKYLEKLRDNARERR